ncbi:hypothetical protein D3C78_1875170 [compost metagenome]
MNRRFINPVTGPDNLELEYSQQWLTVANQQSPGRNCQGHGLSDQSQTAGYVAPTNLPPLIKLVGILK